jgi:hypothetical protein
MLLKILNITLSPILYNEKRGVSIEKSSYSWGKSRVRGGERLGQVLLRPKALAEIESGGGSDGARSDQDPRTEFPCLRPSFPGRSLSASSCAVPELPFIKSYPKSCLEKDKLFPINSTRLPFMKTKRRRVFLIWRIRLGARGNAAQKPWLIQTQQTK